MTHSVKFIVDKAGRGKVWVDGNEINASELTYEVKGGGPSIISIKFMAEVDGQVEFREITGVAAKV